MGHLGLAAAVALLSSAGPLASASETGTLRVGAVQGNVSERGAEAMSQARAIAANHADGTRELLDEVGPGELDLVLWPESASDIDPRTDAGVAAAVDGAAQAVGAPILLGTQRFVSDRRYNDYILWEPNSGARQGVSYTKQRPVPFGEYVPYRDFFRWITTAVDLVTTDMVPGTGSALLSVPVERLERTLPITAAICFEVAFDDLIREGVRAGGELIVIPTTNASFGMTQESTQQLAMSRFRAVEHGRAVVQVSTVGVSGIIGPDGVVWDQTGLFTAEQMAAGLPLRTTLTPAATLGAWPGVAVGLLALAAVLSGMAAHVRAGRGGGVKTMTQRRAGGTSPEQEGTTSGLSPWPIDALRHP